MPLSTLANITAFRLTLALFATAAVGCSTFERDWEALVATPPTGDLAPDPAGLWEGTWLSDYNGHTGTLRCILEHVEGNAFSARYKATYAGWLTFEYTMSMTVREEKEAIAFSGEADLGSMAGGVYTYDGRVSDEAFHSTYKSSGDHGTFDMHRVSRLSTAPPSEDSREEPK